MIENQENNRKVIYLESARKKKGGKLSSTEHQENTPLLMRKVSKGAEKVSPNPIITKKTPFTYSTGILDCDHHTKIMVKINNQHEQQLPVHLQAYDWSDDQAYPLSLSEQRPIVLAPHSKETITIPFDPNQMRYEVRIQSPKRKSLRVHLVLLAQPCAEKPDLIHIQEIPIQQQYPPYTFFMILILIGLLTLLPVLWLIM
ncbi:hypothetical protein [Mechercharimyces sp. CAU 1602]|uniref:hypothetical protein n=1 Tax=Mechercharimyces sp. CAU 1602 TaxID=2973933 RepID=UPI002162B110|nr:hypothetical protein [Mechercharimyces sp. CAU 1602]MCS1352148.1 hypothetical protein [Mechercharimyces sp. CAU 1602]